MALARPLSVDGRMDLQYQCTLRGDVIAPYSHLEFLAVAITDKITISDVQMMAERLSQKLRYYLQSSGCIPGRDAAAEAFFAATASLGILDIEIERKSGSNNVSPRWSRYCSMEKDTAINFVLPSCDDFQDPLWVDDGVGAAFRHTQSPSRVRHFIHHFALSEGPSAKNHSSIKGTRD
ncbi:hypothetical protein PLEOSDRAFT_1100995 [Pleurotus ostreatus PC15]|uniref:Uncharacterized protein n=1 Tax=Pleurotus ostreatus (strain PC15) TaxID=1137138 RepID=A0A067P266_PLEO1|nr:hypothetical protein PLEOSDRAFT_1100995 [Pleurotus ostreatus PC15]